MLIGPVFSRELVTAPRRPKLFLYRAVYAGVLFVLMCTAWLILAGTQVIHNVGDMSRFGMLLFVILAPLQLALMVFFAAMTTASAVAQEKDRRTLVLLLMTRLNNCELVLGRLMSSLLNVLVMLLAGLPVFMLVTLFGGVSFHQVGRVFAITFATALAAGSLGSTIALWREKTFQTLALTALALVFWIGGWEAVGAGALGESVFGIGSHKLATAFSPLRAVVTAARPAVDRYDSSWLSQPVNLYLLVAAAMTLALNGIAIARVRIWNPSREIRRSKQPNAAEQASIFGERDPAAEEVGQLAEQARTGHVDSKLRNAAAGASRRVWDNPVLWREVCTWAYGRKVIAIRTAYWILFALATVGTYWTTQNGVRSAGGLGNQIADSARVLVPFFVVSLVIVNALAVTSITNERDGKSLDLLLVTDLTPKEFLFGKIGGVFWVAKDMIVMPIALCIYLSWSGNLIQENLLFIIGGLLVMDLFVTMLGIHCGMIYANSRTSVGVSLGTVFFLFLGVVTCILMMISFSGSFHTQLAPFLAFILGGGVGLYVSLGSRNPSAAIAASSILLPFATFYAITSFLLNFTLGVFLVIAVTYGFTTAAMMIPALSEFDFAEGRTAAADD